MLGRHAEAGTAEFEPQLLASVIDRNAPEAAIELSVIDNPDSESAKVVSGLVA